MSADRLTDSTETSGSDKRTALSPQADAEHRDSTLDATDLAEWVDEGDIGLNVGNRAGKRVDAAWRDAASLDVGDFATAAGLPDYTDPPS